MSRRLATPLTRRIAALITLAVFLMLVWGAARPVPAAAAAPPAPTVHAKAFVVMDQRTGVVLASKSPNERLPMASTTKIMTGLLALEHFTDLNTVVRAPADSVGVGEDEIYLRKGERLTVDQLLMAVLIQSANDAAADLAEAVAGSQDRFVALMNAKAAALGLKNTHYTNPHGLDEPGHYTSAGDLTRLARLAMADPRFAGYVDRYTATIPWAGRTYKRVLVNHNSLLEHYPWIDGVKTGWTDDAGYCIAAAGTYHGHEVMVTLLGEPDDLHRMADAIKLFRWSAGQYGRRMLVVPGAVLAHAAVPYHDEGVSFVPLAAVSAVILRAASVTTKVTAPSTVSLPVRRGAAYGTVRFYADGVKIGATRLVAQQSFEKAGWGTRIGYQVHRAWSWVTSLL
jgi:D-alanyl-D-alanine carboxypeptidase (penicillin-binding protein 5/6)